MLNIAKFIKSKIDFQPKIGLILGSGLGDFADKIEICAVLPYAEIPNFPVSTAPGHRGQFVFGYVGSAPVVIMQGRIHYYEGYSMQEVVLPTRIMALLGIEVLFLTNAVGGIHPALSAGGFMVIKDHISSFIPSPLIGKNTDELGVRFPDMTNIYTPELREIIKSTARAQGVDIHEGTYIQFTGPQFETPAEIQMCTALGADAVGMSTACEAIAAAHAGLKVCAVSVVSNLAAGIAKNPLTLEEVYQTANKTAPVFQKLVYDSIQNIYNHARNSC